jgi:antitoxin (DNA-binding transcriptional repressor) of toxin-antitoxin stability system
MTVTSEIGVVPLPELIKQVQAGCEVLLTEANKPVAKLVAVMPERTASPLKIPSFKGHKVLAPNFSHADIAEEMLNRE